MYLKKGKYTKGEAKRIVGTYQAHARGFGFVAVEGEDDDIFISEDDTNGAFHGDQVEVTIKSAPDGKRREGKVDADFITWYDKACWIFSEE